MFQNTKCYLQWARTHSFSLLHHLNILVFCFLLIEFYSSQCEIQSLPWELLKHWVNSWQELGRKQTHELESCNRARPESQCWLRTCRGTQFFIQHICTASGNPSPETCIYSSKATGNKISSTPNTPYCFLNRLSLPDWRGEQSEYPIWQSEYPIWQSEYPISPLGSSSKRQEMQVWNTSGCGGLLPVFGQVVLPFMGTSTSFFSFSFKLSQPHWEVCKGLRWFIQWAACTAFQHPTSEDRTSLRKLSNSRHEHHQPLNMPRGSPCDTRRWL